MSNGSAASAATVSSAYAATSHRDRDGDRRRRRRAAIDDAVAATARRRRQQIEVGAGPMHVFCTECLLEWCVEKAPLRRSTCRTPRRRRRRWARRCSRISVVERHLRPRRATLVAAVSRASAPPCRPSPAFSATAPRAPPRRRDAGFACASRRHLLELLARRAHGRLLRVSAAQRLRCRLRRLLLRRRSMDSAAACTRSSFSRSSLTSRSFREASTCRARAPRASSASLRPLRRPLCMPPAWRP